MQDDASCDKRAAKMRSCKDRFAILAFFSRCCTYIGMSLQYLDASRSRLLLRKVPSGICVGECLDPSGNLPGATDGCANVCLALDTNALATGSECALEFMHARCSRETLRNIRNRASINLLHILILSRVVPFDRELEFLVH